MVCAQVGVWICLYKPCHLSSAPPTLTPPSSQIMVLMKVPLNNLLSKLLINLGMGVMAILQTISKEVTLLHISILCECFFWCINTLFPSAESPLLMLFRIQIPLRTRFRLLSEYKYYIYLLSNSCCSLMLIFPSILSNSCCCLLYILLE